MEQQRTTKRLPRQGVLATAGRALASDAALTARAGSALAGATASGVAAGLAMALIAERWGDLVPWLLVGLGAGAALGLGLVVWAIADRRHARAARRARRRVILALTVLNLGVVAAAPLLSPRAAPIALVLGLLLALAVTSAGVGAMISAERAMARAAAARRRGWHARIRASRLTRRMLGAGAYRQLRREGALPVDSALYPGRTYLVPLRTTPSGARILVLQGGQPIGGLCLRPREVLPDPEEALAHILAIRADERAWLERANFFPQDRFLTPQARGLLPGRPGNYDR